ncbi:spindle pole body interacting protein [Wallemia mellicola CBS 633.66]|uniref:Spindle pole body interacting protein n=1 Tax=Wallemia mellicola (strain ATCC MYA-4683 / CBS 633.66) TaxID=671144 RepID=I4YCE4_WALMC|nr:spindle pole body interacting protein [Wallemia mellicola CBS 633.66]EIM21636.1 spindle pole body interacting protein [Wallemia mellicola CBS 633.66]|eukprot:XP_006958331.1 spindle pole body interacting protein [Wallemia mellicola CBS 633.66]
MENNVAYCLLAEFDIDQGSTLSQQYPFPTGTDEHLLADLMIPEGAHDQNEDWTIFFLNQTPANTIAPPLDSEAPTPFIKHRRTYSKVLDQEVNPKPQLLYVLNLVRTKKDDTVPRGALVKALAICSKQPYIHIYKPILLLALEDYFQSGSPSILSRLYDAINNINFSLVPPISRSEKSILRAAPDRKDLFAEKWSHSYFKRPSDDSDVLSSAFEDDLTGNRRSSSNSKTNNSLEEEFEEKLKRTSLGFSDPLSESIGHQSYLETIPVDTHYYKTTIGYVNVDYKKISLPTRVPLATFDEEIGDYSIINLIQTFSAHPVPSSPMHPHLHTSGASTHPIILLFNALITQKRVVFLGYGKPASLVTNFVLAACALVSGGGGVLRGFIERAFPYTCLKDLDNFLMIPGYIAGVTNPRFEDNHAWWDVLFNINTGKVTVSSQIEPVHQLKHNILSSPSPIPTYQTLNNGISSQHTSLSTPIPSSVIMNQSSSSNSVNHQSMHSNNHVLSSPPSRSKLGISDSFSSAMSNASDDASITTNQKNENNHRESSDNIFMNEIMALINEHYGEAHIRARFADLVSSFVKIASRYEEETSPNGQTSIGFPSQPFSNGQLGSGTVFTDESNRVRELSANAFRIEGWQETATYKNYVHDFQQYLKTRAIKDIDIAHQIHRLRTAKGMNPTEAHIIYRSLAQNTETYEQVVEIIEQLSPHLDGLLPLGFGLLHPHNSVRDAAMDFFIKLQSYPLGSLQLSTLNAFYRLALMRQIDHRYGQQSAQQVL